MRFTLPTNKQPSEGFTLIEVLIIAPVVILAIGGFVALIVSMVGDVLLTRDSNALTFGTQRALDRIEQDIRLGTQFLTTTDTLTAPQGSNNNFTGNAPFTNSTANTFIMSAVTTDENPTSSTRWLVYYANQPNPCGDTQSYNRVFLMKVIYFIKDGSLWRRSVLPDYNTNESTPDANTVCAWYDYVYQRDSCSPGYSLSTRCETNDEQVMENVASMNVEYFAEPGDTTPIAASSAKTAKTVKITINSSKTTAGEQFTFSGSVRATRLNNIDSSIPPPATPSLSYTLSAPASAKFSWSHIPTANSYEISYNINGGTEVTQSLSADIRTFTVDANRNDTITFKVKARNASGDSPEAVLSPTMPAWTSYELLNGWVDYSPTFAPHAYTRTSNGVVVLKGLIKNGTATWDTPIFTLPVGYRPPARLIFYVGTSNSGSSYGRIDVLTNGDVRFMQGTAGWISMDSIRFLPGGTWTNLTMQNGWINYGSGYPNLSTALDSGGRVHLRGLVRDGPTSPTHTIIGGTLPTARRPARQMILPGITSGTGFASYDIKPTDVVTRSAVTTYISTNAMYYPSAVTGWTNLSLQNGWVEYSTTFTSPQYIKNADGIVTLKGLIKTGTATNGTVIANLPAGFRPKEKLIFSSVANSHHARIDVASNGNITIEGSGDVVWMCLDDISFIAEQ